MILGIDAHNIRAGGGITHLSELLAAAKPDKHGFEKVVVWGGDLLLSKLTSNEWIELETHPYLNKGFFWRICWVLFIRSKRIQQKKCNIIFVPGGTDFSHFHPLVSMSQNLLPFENKEILRYGIGLKLLKFSFLRYFQSSTFKKSDGVIFLTPYAKGVVEKFTGSLKGQISIISHGINPKFFKKPSLRKFRYTQDFTAEQPCKLIYVSIIEIYKHQWQVVRAVNLLRKEGFHVHLDLIGPPGPGTPLLEKSISELKDDDKWLKYHGNLKQEEIQLLYSLADIGIFASSCETYGQIVSESMAASLPMACSYLSSMKEVIGVDTIYFHPENPAEIALAIRKLIHSATLRKRNAERGYENALKYSWERSADESFEFFKTVYTNFREAQTNKTNYV